MPDRFWANDKGVLTDELTKAAIERHSQEATRAKEIPAGPEHYKVELPPDFKVPEGMTFTLDSPDVKPLLEYGAKLATDLKWTQAEYQKAAQGIVALKAEEAKQRYAADQAFQATVAADLSTLGASKDQRITDSRSFLVGIGASGLAKLLTEDIPTARIINEVELLRSAYLKGGGTINAGGGGQQQPPEREPLHVRMFPSMKKAS